MIDPDAIDNDLGGMNPYGAARLLDRAARRGLVDLGLRPMGPDEVHRIGDFAHLFTEHGLVRQWHDALYEVPFDFAAAVVDAWEGPITPADIASAWATEKGR